MKVTVGIFEHPAPKSTQLAAYTRYYNPSWDGCCEHTVEVARRRDAKPLAIAEHRARCMKRMPEHLGAACCEPAPDGSGRRCDKMQGHDGKHWTYGGATMEWPRELHQ